MAKQVARQTTILFGGTSIADHCSSIDIKDEKEEVDTSNLGNGIKESVHGLRSGEITLDLQQDYAPGSVFQLIKSAYDGEVLTAFEFRPQAAARSTSNPASVANVLVFNLEQGAKIGELIMMQATLRVQGAGFTYPTA